MLDVVKGIITNILTSLYQPFWFSLLLSILFMFVWKHYSTVKEAIICWLKWFKTDSCFRKVFFLVFYTVMILFRTLLNRNMWLNPVSDVFGIWGLYRYDATKNEMILSTEVPENLALFIPFAILLIWTYKDKMIGTEATIGKILLQSMKNVFIFSLIIESLQLFLRLGTWQLSDLFYNTLGGMIGGLIYWCGCRINHR